MPVQLNLIFASSTTIGTNHDTGSNVSPSNRIVMESESYKKKFDVPLIDVAIAIICFVLLVSLALLIDANMQETITDDAGYNSSQMIAITLIIAFLLVSIFVCVYATHRMGVCMWTGPLESSDDAVDGEIDFQPECYILDLPPSYKSIMEELPPSYNSAMNKFKFENNCVVVNINAITNHINVSGDIS